MRPLFPPTAKMGRPKPIVFFLFVLAVAAALDDDDIGAVPTCDPNSAGKINCTDGLLFHAMVRATMAAFPDLHFSRFGRPAPAGDDYCDMAWRARPASAARGGSALADAKDFRRFRIAVSANCEYTILSIGGYHSGPNARKPRKNSTGSPFLAPPPPAAIPESHFARSKYLLYMGGADRCRNMKEYLNSLLCALGEARYLNRVLVIDPSVCLAAEYTTAKQPEEGKLLWFYFDYDSVVKGGNVLEEKRFWDEWDRSAPKHKMSIKVVEDATVTPMKLAKMRNSVLMRKFGDVSFWSSVCDDGEARAKISRPYHILKNAQGLINIARNIVERMNGDFDSVHIVNGGKQKGNSLDDALAEVKRKIAVGRSVYVVGEADSALLAVIRESYSVHTIDDFKELWMKGSNWYLLTRKLNSGVSVELDGYMRELINKDVFLKGKKLVEVILG